MGDRHNQIRKAHTLTQGVMSSSPTSDITNIQFLDNIGLEWVWSGSPVGNFQVQISADYDPNEKVAGNWVPLLFTYWNGSAFVTDYNIPTTMGSPYYIDLTLLSAPWLKVIYSNTSGSGTLNEFLTAKAL